MMFLKPLRLIGLLALSFIVIIHLKNKKLKELEVSSTKLWEKVFEDISKVKKRKINKYILLALHLLIGIFIICAFSEPIFLGKNKDDFYILAFDCSMSMNAIEKDKSRMEIAKEKALEYIKSLPKNSRINLVHMTENTEIIKENISKSDGEKEIKKLKAVKKPLDLEKSNKFLNSFGKNTVIFTDKDVFKNNKVIKIGEKLEDIGIIHGGVDKSLNKSFCIVKNYGDLKKKVDIALKDNRGNDVALNECTLKPKEEKKAFFHNTPRNLEKLNFQIINKDMIYENNNYSIDLSKNNDKKILLLGENYFIEKALEIMPNMEIVKKEQIDFNKEKFDFYIICKEVKDVPKDEKIWWINTPKDMISNNKIKGYVNISQSKVTQGMENLKVYGEGIEIVNKNVKSLMCIDDKAIMAADNKGNIYSSLDWTNTDMVITPAFPVLVDNILKINLRDNKEDFQYYDYVINENEQLNDNKGSFISYINTSLKNIAIIIVLILLIVEWQVFKLGY
ncbi:hypothetical protein OR62_03835 [Clostridium tetani]|uniref:Aerotolerance regulator N-terminal domain-containing protein n=1 Tax=Clostridium tetani TaxID=1513 RepID=A0ABY0EQR8_CLOTA|nr:BatA and WFA domain-containing protein [Clostridium tetani]KHO39841.1 hypothetical protein OR62_03835 [Clostridium tetani]RXI54584.1 hypothetical protein DP131_09950 [Clostridium tetani]RXI69106.1 hypothetical protein DQN76_08310 [Clostridium tetani]